MELAGDGGGAAGDERRSVNLPSPGVVVDSCSWESMISLWIFEFCELRERSRTATLVGAASDTGTAATSRCCKASKCW